MNGYHNFDFTLFLAHEVKEKEVDLYDGVYWGWENHCVVQGKVGDLKKRGAELACGDKVFNNFDYNLSDDVEFSITSSNDFDYSLDLSGVDFTLNSQSKFFNYTIAIADNPDFYFQIASLSTANMEGVNVTTSLSPACTLSVGPSLPFENSCNFGTNRDTFLIVVNNLSLIDPNKIVDNGNFKVRFSQVPAPAGLLGLAGIFKFSRRIRRRIKLHS